tara:strand:+ start:65 stop:349 length:285 start_codon:yes stop_codon:yes gene_type:complete
MDIKKNKVFIECDCYSEGIMLEYEDDDFPHAYISMWKRGINPRKMGILWRLKYAWIILTGGELYGDEVILKKESLIKMKSWLDKTVQSMEVREN